jgi:predicted permease
MRSVLRDIRLAVRTLLKAPTLTAISVVTIALGVGATTAVFSVVHGVLLRRLPYAAGSRLVHVVQPSSAAPDVGLAYLEIRDYAEQVPEIERVAEYHSMPFQLYGRGEPQRVQVGVVGDRFFEMFGVKPLLGRSFLPGEDAVGAPPVVLVSYKYWAEQLGRDPHVVGQTFTMNDHVHTIVGVLPPLPTYPDANDMWMPAGACPFRSNPAALSSRRARIATAFAVLKPGATIDRARQSLGLVSRRLHASYPEAFPPARQLGIGANAVREEITSGSRRLFLTLLATAVFVLVIAGANFTNLTLAAQLRRGREMALRATLGADRRRLFRQLVTESLCVTVTGGALGVAFATGGLGLLRAFAARVTPRADEIALDAPVLAVSLLLCVVIGAVAAVAPLLRGQRGALIDQLRASAAATSNTRGGGRARSALVGLQVAVASVLLVGAGLMTRSLVKLQAVDGGYSTENVMTARIDLNWTKYTSARHAREFVDRLAERLETTRGVESFAVATDFPLNNAQPNTRLPFRIKGRDDLVDDAAPRADFTSITPGYFRTIGVPVLRGRDLTAADRDSANPVALIGRRLADTYWPRSEPLGAQVSVDGGTTWATIVGVVGDVRQNSLAEDVTDELYLPFAMNPGGGLRVLVRTAGATGAVGAFRRDVKRVVHDLDSEQPVYAIQSLDELRGTRLSEPRVTTTLMLLFAALALVITAGGLGGVVGFSVSQRVNEIGVRLALGAKPWQVLSMVMRQGMAIVVAGLAVGLGVALAGARLIGGLLFDVGTTDAPTFAGVALVLASIAAVACYVPARRAMRVRPADALRAR